MRNNNLEIKTEISYTNNVSNTKQKKVEVTNEQRRTNQSISRTFRSIRR